MARYFFHLLGSLRWADDEGEEFPDLSTACQCAIDRITEVQMRAGGGAETELSIQVTTEDGATLFAVSLGQPVPPLPRTANYRLN